MGAATGNKLLREFVAHCVSRRFSGNEISFSVNPGLPQYFKRYFALALDLRKAARWRHPPLTFRIGFHDLVTCTNILIVAPTSFVRIFLITYGSGSYRSTASALFLDRPSCFLFSLTTLLWTVLQFETRAVCNQTHVCCPLASLEALDVLTLVAFGPFSSHHLILRDDEIPAGLLCF